jgi:hypothetical protein
MSFASFDVDVQTAIETTDNTVTPILTNEMPQDSSALIEILVLARNPANGATKCWTLLQPRKRVGTGSATVVGSAADLLPSSADSGTTTWALSLTTLGDRIQMNVAGANGVTIHWYAKAWGMVVQ